MAYTSLTQPPSKSADDIRPFFRVVNYVISESEAGQKSFRPDLESPFERIGSTIDAALEQIAESFFAGELTILGRLSNSGETIPIPAEYLAGAKISPGERDDEWVLLCPHGARDRVPTWFDLRCRWSEVIELWPVEPSSDNAPGIETDVDSDVAKNVTREAESNIPAQHEPTSQSDASNPDPPDEHEPTSKGLTNAARSKGGQRSKIDGHLQDALNRIAEDLHENGGRLTVGALRDWLTDKGADAALRHASEDEFDGYDFEPPVPGCDNLYIDGPKLVWTNDEANEQSRALRNLYRYIVRARDHASLKKTASSPV